MKTAHNAALTVSLMGSVAWGGKIWTVEYDEDLNMSSLRCGEKEVLRFAPCDGVMCDEAWLVMVESAMWTMSDAPGRGLLLEVY